MKILGSHEAEFGINSGVAILSREGSALDAIEAATQLVEDTHDARTVGYGGAPNILGEMELDATIMDGDTRMAGSVGALQGIRHPISAARRVMETLPHVLLVGEGARRFALECGLEARDMLSPEAKIAYDRWCSEHSFTGETKVEGKLAPFISFSARKDLSKGTVVFLALDNNRRMAACASTSGWAYKYPGRLGDSPVVGGGVYVDSRYGGAVCTHTGEMTIRAGTARSVVLALKRGLSPEESCEEAIRDLQDLQGGYIGPVILHVMNPLGETCVMSTGGDDGDVFWEWDESSKAAISGDPRRMRALGV